MEKLGFRVEICTAEQRSYTFPNMNTLYDSVKAVNPFLANIPDNKHSDYFEDYTAIMRKLDTVKLTGPIIMMKKR
ncbi:hypothetical protein HHI36_009863 [Cryptolaemus montrouzieri]|uniref:Uncharacterized protein n=1 Tax=Cryptolaemus montrouzieri TaxID=559131 RepID=A0ABD2MH03_9CUCU